MTVAMDGSVNDEIQGIEEDIQQIAIDNPHCKSSHLLTQHSCNKSNSPVAKWFTATPELMQKK